MKPENKRVAGQLGRSLSGSCWHGPSVMEALDGVTYTQASRHPGHEIHSIWELVKHITVWHRMAAQTLAGEQYVSLTGEADWPRVKGETDSDWHEDLQALANANATLVEVVRSFPSERLDELVPGKEFDFYNLLHGIAQHNIYHAGQISLLKKLTL